MSVRTFLILATLTAMSVILVVVLWSRDEQPATAPEAGQVLFPDLADQLNRITKVRVATHDKTFTITGSGLHWSLEESGGYPVPVDRVREVVVGLATLQTIEPKTMRPDRYGYIGVAPIADEGSTARRVQVADAQGTLLADLLVGTRVFRVGSEGSVFVRKPDEARAWLARGTLDPGTAVPDWVDPEILSLDPHTIRRIVVTRADGTTLAAERDTPESQAMHLVDLPAGMRARNVPAADAMARVFADLKLQDVRPADSVSFADAPLTHVTVSRFDAPAITLTIAEIKGSLWLTVANTETADAPAANGEAPPKADWAYQVARWKLAPLLRPLAELVEPEQAVR